MDNQVETTKKEILWKVFGIFCAVIILICSFVFVFDYNSVYDNDTGGGWIAPSDGVVFVHFVIAFFSVLVAVILKIVFKKKTSLMLLITAAIILPIICYNSNYFLLKKDGIFYSLVDKGGPLHFIANHDFNLDGVNDKDYSIDHNERKCSNGYGGHFNDKIIKKLTLTATGTGKRLEHCFPTYDWEDQVIELHIKTNNINLKELELKVDFIEPSTAEKTKFFLYDTDGLLLEHKANKDGSVSIIFDTETCQSWQRNANGHSIELPIKYYVS